MNGNCKAKKSQSISKHSLNTRLSDQLPKTKKSVTVISHNRRSEGTAIANGRNTPIDTKLLQTKNSSEKYVKPELNSALILSKRLDALHNANTEKLADFNQMTPRTKAIATEKVRTCAHATGWQAKVLWQQLIDWNFGFLFFLIITLQALKKLNFPSDKSVYKCLVPVNVNDSVLDVKPSSLRRQSKSKTRVQTAKDPEPTLSHYLKPTPRLQHQLELDDDDDSDFNDKSINRSVNNQFKRMYEFYEQYLCPLGAHLHGHCDSQSIDTP